MQLTMSAKGHKQTSQAQTIVTIKSAGMTIGEIRGRSKPTHEKQDDDDDQDDANDTYATMTEAVAVATEAATEATKQENDEDDNENEF